MKKAETSLQLATPVLIGLYIGRTSYFPVTCASHQRKYEPGKQNEKETLFHKLCIEIINYMLQKSCQLFK